MDFLNIIWPIPIIVFLVLYFALIRIFIKSMDSSQAFKIGMTKSQIKEILGDPITEREAKKDKNGRIIEVWSYIFNRGRKQIFWFYFQDGKLAKWGQRLGMLMQLDSKEKKIYEDLFREGKLS